jgi:hypothetical protein
MPADTLVMLDLLHEAGEEAVTLDELGVAGVADPARALLQLELAGFGIQRVVVGGEAGRSFECVRLAEEQPTAELAAVAPRPAAPAPATAPAADPRLARALLAGLLLALLALALRRG